jgi:site-specific DNA recombinase
MKRQSGTIASVLRAALYVRVSSEEQVQGYSLDAQDRAGRLFCDAHGWEIVRTYRDEGKSARTDDLGKRPAFQHLLNDAEVGLIDVIVVHKLDRFARNLLVTLETLTRLERAHVGFVSISEQMDFTTANGKVLLAMLAAFAQHYSDNLSWETKKGKAERKAQGLFNGLLPFGVKKNSDGIPVPDPETYPGLLLAFRQCADGKSDREVANELNEAGFRTSGNRGQNLFTKDTVCRLLQNRFYLGELPDGPGWMAGAHEPLLDDDLFDRAQTARRANRRSFAPRSVAPNRRTHSLSGLGICGYCGGRLHITTDRHGKARVYCYRGRQAARCGQRSTFLDGFEAQIATYLGTFQLPDETVLDVIRMYDQASALSNDAESRRRAIEGRLERIRELYKWGDLTRSAYASERDNLDAELTTLRGNTDRATMLTEAAALLRDLPAAWEAASPDQRNRLARLVFESVEVKDDQLVAVIAQPDFAPFFLASNGDLSQFKTNENDTEEPVSSSEVMTGRKRRDSNPRSQP